MAIRTVRMHYYIADLHMRNGDVIPYQVDRTSLPDDVDPRHLLDDYLESSIIPLFTGLYPCSPGEKARSVDSTLVYGNGDGRGIFVVRRSDICYATLRFETKEVDRP